jgi:hypothetical protein
MASEVNWLQTGAPGGQDKDPGTLESGSVRPSIQDALRDSAVHKLYAAPS